MAKRSWRMVKAVVFLLVVAFGSSIVSAQEQPVTPPPEPPPPVEFRQLHPDARKLIIDEIRLQLQTEGEQRFAQFTSQAENWFQIGSGVLAVVGALLALLGWRGLSNVRQTIKNDLLTFVRTDGVFQAEIEKKLAAISDASASKVIDKSRREINMARLELLSDKISKSTEFSALERKAMVELLLSVKDDADLTKTDSFEKTVYSVVRTLYNADVDVAIDELEDSLGDFFSRSPPLCSQLVDHYGERMLAASNSDEELARRFRKYVAACKAQKMYEYAVPYLLALSLRDKGTGWTGAIDAILKEVRYFTDPEKGVVLKRFTNASERKPDESVTYRGQRETELLSAFYAEYRAQLDKACQPKGE